MNKWIENIAKHVLCECNFDSKKFNSNQRLNNDNVDVTVKNIIYVKKIIFEILLSVVAKMVYI